MTYGAKKSVYFFLASSQIKDFFLTVFDSALKVGMSVGSEVVNLLMLMARAYIDMEDFILISETK